MARTIGVRVGRRSSLRPAVGLPGSGGTAGTYIPSSATTGAATALFQSGTSSWTVTGSHAPVSNTDYYDLEITNSPQPNGVSNVRYFNCKFTYSPGSPAVGAACYRANLAHTNFEFWDCTFRPTTPHYNINAIIGHDFKAYRCDMDRVVDGFSGYNNLNGPGGAGDDSLRNGPGNGEVWQCYIHDHIYSANPPDTSHSDGTHADGFQIQGCNGWVIVGNRITGLLAPEYQPGIGGGIVATSAILANEDIGNSIYNLTITDNFLGGGGATLNIAPPLASTNIGTVLRNRFDRNSQTGYAINVPASCLSASNFGVGTSNCNRWADTDAELVIHTTAG